MAMRRSLVIILTMVMAMILAAPFIPMNVEAQMATDMVTSPITPLGSWIYALAIGFIIGLIRLFGGYPEGVSFAILLMNATTPLLDRWTRPKVFGEVQAK